MPYKKCKSCGKENGVRTKMCECGKPFHIPLPTGDKGVAGHIGYPPEGTVKPPPPPPPPPFELQIICNDKTINSGKIVGGRKPPKQDREVGGGKPPKPDKIVIGVGSSTWERPKGMPEPFEPEPIPRDRQLSKEEVCRYVEFEGLGFCIYTLVPASKIEDEKLRSLWMLARKSMQEIIGYLYD